MAIVRVYIDGFNLYYRALKGTPYKWLDIVKLAEQLQPGHTIDLVRYFTAIVKPRPSDPQQQQRQQSFIRAIQTSPQVSVHLGSFLESNTWMPLATPIVGYPNKTVHVMKTEEKGSDVNLASLLLIDAFNGHFETAVVITNDSDLVYPIKFIRSKLGKNIGVAFPGTNNQSYQLKRAARFQLNITPAMLAASQFPTTLVDETGTIAKPPSW